jgi:hypothetical protein
LLLSQKELAPQGLRIFLEMMGDFASVDDIDQGLGDGGRELVESGKSVLENYVRQNSTKGSVIKKSLGNTAPDIV